MFKWIGAVAGYFLLGRRFVGALLGFFVGSFIDNFQQVRNVAENARANGGQYRRGFSSDDLFGIYQQQSSQHDFATMLMALSAAVMQADGKVLHAELNYVKNFLSQQFGPQFNASHLQVLKKFLDADQIPLEQICSDIQRRLAPESRVQLLYYLFGIAKSDGHVSETEMKVIERIAGLMGIRGGEFESVSNMFYRNPDSDFKVLELSPDATNEEIKKAYRKMAVKYHPDKVAQLGEEYQKGAKEKFQKVQEAYENLKKSRGF
ncbi:MAG: molecular chaperone DjiA [Bacteroidetes bacterium]|nr:MAG: molecular chaperone DjiA [Bacteroidota bacterium]